MPYINGGAILFTIEVEVYLLFVEREDRGWVLECFETHHKWGFILVEGAQGTCYTDLTCELTPWPPLLKREGDEVGKL